MHGNTMTTRLRNRKRFPYDIVSVDYDALSVDFHNFFYYPFFLESTQIAAFARSH